MKTEITFWDAFLIMLNSIGGNTIFIVVGTIATFTGSMGMILVATAIVGALNYSLARCVMEVAILIPKPGGPYIYIWEVFGELCAFLFFWGYTLLLVGPLWTLKGYTTALYLVQLAYPSCNTPSLPVSFVGICILLLVVVVNCLYLKYVTRVQGFLSSIKILAQIFIIMTAIVVWTKGDSRPLMDVFEGSLTDPGNMAVAFLAVQASFGGWMSITFLVGEMKEPEKTLPKAVGLAFLVIFLLNELTVASYYVVLSHEQVSSSDATAGVFIDNVFRPLSPVIAVMTTMSSIGTLNAAVLSQSRFVLAAANKGHLITLFRTVSMTYKMPWPVTMALTTFSVLLLAFSDVRTIIMALGFILIFIYIVVVLCVIVLRWKTPNGPRPLRVWLGSAIFHLILNSAILVLSIYQKPQVAGNAALIVLSGIPVYWICIQWERKPAGIRKTTEKLLILCQKLFLLELSQQKPPVTPVTQNDEGDKTIVTELDHKSD